MAIKPELDEGWCGNDGEEEVRRSMTDTKPNIEDAELKRVQGREILMPPEEVIDLLGDPMDNCRDAHYAIAVNQAIKLIKWQAGELSELIGKLEAAQFVMNTRIESRALPDEVRELIRTGNNLRLQYSLMTSPSDPITIKTKREWDDAIKAIKDTEHG